MVIRPAGPLAAGQREHDAGSSLPADPGAGAAEPAPGHNRRELLIGGAAAGLSVFAVAACGSVARARAGTAVAAGAGRTGTDAPPRVNAREAVMLNALLAIEQRGIAAYTAATPLLSGFVQQAAARFLSQELQHAGTLRKLVKLGGKRPHDPDPYYELGHPRNPAEVLALLHQVEHEQLDAYLATLPRISDPKTRQYLASIIANDAQHVAVLRANQGMPVLAPPLLATTE